MQNSGSQNPGDDLGSITPQNLETPANPYRSPQTSAEPPAELTKTPGAGAILLIVVVSILATGCTFYCTCFGVALAGVAITNNLDSILFGVIVGVIAALAVIILLPRYMYRRMSRSRL